MQQLPTPSEIMRARRPYLYSDTEFGDDYRLTEAELRHHLDTLTDRNQHKDFENFCRKLAERELTPNLRPQTGPEGGGDGKVDTETYPVSEGVSERWFMSHGGSGEQRWGFAFSAKKAWKQKVHADVSGIVGTGRIYDRIIFISSRPAKQVDRLRIETELTAEFGVKVTILDLEWIVDRVFTNDHKDLAFEYLRAGAHEPDKVKLGPNDFRRQQELEEIEGRLKKPGVESRDHSQAISDAFEAARLSRELERPRIETEGRFGRAIALAKKYGIRSQVLRAVYEHAWTAFWWFDDVDAMQAMYEQVEEIAFPTNDAAHISKVHNIHQLLIGRVAYGLETAEELSLAARSERLKTILTRLAGDRSRPNNALYAAILLALHDANEKFVAGERGNFDDTWIALSGIIKRAAGMGEFPAELLDSIVAAMSEALPDSDVFDSFVEQLAEFMAERQKEVAAGDVYLTQGKRKLDRNKPIDAIKWLGRAVVNLGKEECREEQSHALLCLSAAYRQAGLLWAAQTSGMASLIQCLALSELEGELRVETLTMLALLRGISLQLGAVTDCLAAHQFIRALSERMALDAESQQRIREEHGEFDRMLSCLLVIQPAGEIARLERLPDVLDGMGLYTARTMLLYRLGYLDVLRADGSLPSEVPDKEVDEVMMMAAAHPATKSLPKQLVLMDERFIGVRTRIIGVEIEVVTDSTDEGFLRAETYAAALEGFVATLLNSEVYPSTHALKLRVTTGSVANASVSTDENGSVVTVIPSDWSFTNAETLGNVQTHLVEAGIHVLVGIAFMKDALATIEEIVRTEQAFDRATRFCHSGIFRRRAFGTFVGQISDWDQLVTKSYPPRDGAPAAPVVPQRGPESADDADETSVSDDLQSHHDLVVWSVVNKTLWDRAGWEGLIYGWSRIGQPPFLGFMFRDGAAGDAIFEEWISRFGREDAQDKIRVALLRGISKDSPLHYRGHVSQNIDAFPTDGKKRYINHSRTTTMTPERPGNLETFLEHLGASGRYVLTPASIGSSGLPEFHKQFSILKRTLYVRDAWEVGSTDVDAMAIRSTDTVFIPPNVEAAPVTELLEGRARRRKQA